jgi:pimeloyl-ACP methyl ester carboxylesterase
VKEVWLDGHGSTPLHALTWGRRTRRAPLLLLHGLGGNTVTWEAVGADLARELGTRVVAVDLPGFGLSRRGGRPSTIGANADLVVALTDELGSAVVVGNSMGGTIGLRAAVARPDRVLGLVTLNAPWPRLLPAALRTMDRDDVRSLARFAAVAVPRVGERVFHRRQRALGPEGVVDVPVSFLFHDAASLAPHLRDRLIAVSAQRFGWGEEASAAYVEATRSLWRSLFDPRASWADVRAATTPTLVVHGVADRLVPLRVVRPVLDARPDWEHVALDGAGHVPQMESPGQVVTTIVAWVKERLLAREAVTAPR